MVRDIVKEFPDLGSFLYGHWEDFEINYVAFLVLMGVLLSLLAMLVLGGVVGYVLQSVAIAKIAKKQGAWRNIRVMACLPFVRYFAIGKTAERYDAIQVTEKRRLWGRILLILCCILIPVAVISLIVAFVGLPGVQMFVALMEDGGSFLYDSNSTLVNAIMLILYIILVVIAIPLLLLAAFFEELAALVLVVLPIVGLGALLIGLTALIAARALSGTCYYKILRGHFAQKAALALTLVGAITGWTPVILFVASLKKTA